MNKYLKYILVACFISSFLSCIKDKPEDELEPTAVFTANSGVYVINEGNYLFGNSSVSYYSFSNGGVSSDIFQSANGSQLGDVCQSMYFFNNKTYIVVNNSGKIEVVNSNTFVSTATITGFVSPRYILPVSNNKAYVTDLYSNSISVVDLTTDLISGNIPCNGWTEELVLAYGKAYVTNMYSDKVYVINTATDVMIDSIPVVYGSSSICEDTNGKLWVLCSGNQTLGTYPALVRINPVTDVVEQTFTFPNLTDAPNRLNINGNLNELYYLANGGVYKFSITSSVLPSSPLIAQAGYNFYGLGVDPNTGIIYVADAIDYVQNGVILKYQSDGTYINSFTVGIIPNHLYFN